MIGDKESPGDLVLGQPLNFPVAPEFSIASDGLLGSERHGKEGVLWPQREFTS